MAEDNTLPSSGTSRRDLLRRLAVPMLLLGTGLTLSACGKKPGSLRIPPDDDGNTDRHKYPAQDDDL